jgi:hypothetical protein
LRYWAFDDEALTMDLRCEVSPPVVLAVFVDEHEGVLADIGLRRQQ